MKFIRPNTITDAGGTYTRAAGTATYFNSSGVLTLGSTNVPRENYVYDETTSQWRLDGVLIEPAATNLVLQSATLNTSPWAGVTSVTSAGTSIFGLSTWTIAKTLSSSSESLSQVIGSAVVGDYYILTVALLSGTSNKVDIGIYGGATAWSDSAAGAEILSGPGILTVTPSQSLVAVSQLSASIPTIVKVYRKFTSTESVHVYIYPDNAYSTTLGASIKATMVQLERNAALPISTSYIPTTTATVTRPADTVTGTGMIYSSIAENDYAAWVSGTTYAIGDRVIRTTTTTHKIYERVVAGAGTTAPESDPVNWIEVSPTNRWKLFDESPSTITLSASETMSYILKPGRSNSFSALEVDATEIAVNVYISGERVYSGYTNMLNNENVGNWYEYFYEPFYYQTSLAVTDLLNAALLELPASTDMIITVTLRKSGGTPSIGALVTGIVYELGKTQNGMNLSIIDYSRKDTNDYGNTVLVRRKFSKRLSATFFLYSSKVDVVSNLLTQYRATPVVWIGADNNYNSLVIYGFYRDWNIGIPNNIGSTCNIEIEGLA